MSHQIGMVTRILGRLDMGIELASSTRELLSSSIDMERAMWNQTGMEEDPERQELMETALKSLYEADVYLSEAYNAVQRLYPDETPD